MPARAMARSLGGERREVPGRSPSQQENTMFLYPSITEALVLAEHHHLDLVTHAGTYPPARTASTSLPAAARHATRFTQIIRRVGLHHKPALR